MLLDATGKTEYGVYKMGLLHWRNLQSDEETWVQIHKLNTNSVSLQMLSDRERTITLWRKWDSDKHNESVR